jgi:hypothetical protein
LQNGAYIQYIVLAAIVSVTPDFLYLVTATTIARTARNTEIAAKIYAPTVNAVAVSEVFAI